MTVRKGPHRAPSAAMLTLRELLGDATAQVPEVPWREVEAELSNLSPSVVRSLAERVRVVGMALRQQGRDSAEAEWRERFEEPQRGAG